VQKKVIGFRLIEVSHSGENIADRIASVVEEFGLVDKYWESIPLLYSFAFILDPRANMKGLLGVLDLLAVATCSSYSSYYAEVKDEMYKMFIKYEEKFGGAARSQRQSQPTVPSGKRKQVWGRIFGGPGASVGCSSTTYSAVVSELTAYLDGDTVT
jgi:hypothetical protein